jgi:predicted Zn finger-like uncharacterized protein
MIRFACPACKSVLEAPDKKAGLAVPCPRCQQHVTVPAPVAGVPLPPTPTPAAPPAAETVPVTCPGCGRHIDLPTAEVGTMIECARCDTRFIAEPGGIRKPPSTSEAPAAAARGSWRFASPAALTFSLLLFPLPWVNVSCRAPGSAPQKLASQSGIQAVYGGRTLEPELEAMKDRQERSQPTARGEHPVAKAAEPVVTTCPHCAAGLKVTDEPGRSVRCPKCGHVFTPAQKKSAPSEGPAAAKKSGPDFDFSPLLALYPLCLVAGAAAAGFARTRPLRVFSGAGAAGLAALVLVAQMAAGFPIEHDVAKALADREPPPEGIAPLVPVVDASYTPWLWLSLAGVLVALALAAAEWFAAEYLRGRDYGPRK